MALDRYRPTPGDPEDDAIIARIDRMCGRVDEDGNPVPLGSAAPANLTAIHQATGVSRIVFRGVPYDVPPLGFELGANLLYLRVRFHSTVVATQGTEPSAVFPALKDLIAICLALCGHFRAHVRPVRWLDRLRWWTWHYDPFARLEIEEVDRLTDFFCSCLTRSNVHILQAAKIPAHTGPPTSPTTGRSSRRPIRHGAIQRAARSRGRTSSSE